ncbi:P-loop containing nucleoside triphosphate hydrolase protein [Podospora fimiseda]|uniref:P-loop containing nucleoside triphosphate hydrolase protein n=1 Tax=Podospora fimiseda TaxID=252190 RepID=A0AAN7BIZ0_9PEZI|nr:P-loop containing nucleoside triphosphate hydrolase protein [Podospora fimiseda]
MACSITDKSLGPWAGDSCRGGLDFTLLFEEAVLSVLPTALLIIVTPVQIAWLYGRPKQTSNGLLLPLKQGLTIILGLLKLAVLLLWALPSTKAPRTELTLAAAAINFVAVFPLCALSYFEHTFRASPSFTIQLYLLLTTLLDVVRVRTLWLMPGSAHTALAVTEAATLAFKIILGLVEAARKDQLVLKSLKEQYTKEQLSGLYGRSLFFWLASTLWNGFNRFLVPSDLSGPRDDASAEVLRLRFRDQWDNSPNKSGKTALFWHLFRAMPEKFINPAFPRAIIVALTLTQPMMLERMLTFVQGGDAYEERMDVGYSLIGAFALLYSLLALFNGWYHHACNKLALEMRSQLIDSCYRQLLKLRLAALDSGNATTLINVDMQHIMEGCKILHDIWASIITVGLCTDALFLIVMMVLAGICSAPLGPRQLAWLASTEKRVKSTMSMIAGFKEMKMLGLSPEYLQNIQKLRIVEVELGRRFRRILSVIITLSAASTELSILVAFGGFAIITKIHGTPLTFQTLFASLALLRISLDPLFLLIQGTPALVSMFKCLGRVQDLLNDERLIGFADSPGPAAGLISETISSSSSSSLKDRLEKSTDSFPHAPSTEILVEISDATFCWKGRESESPALYVVGLEVKPASFTAVIGPVGGGKSTLLKAVLGEIEHISGSRRVRRGIKVAFCDQEPWLLDQTIKENIVGNEHYNAEWYNKVVEACALAQDLDDLAKGDATGVGSGGSALSGGQRARVALARAVYRKPDLILLDDIFSGLDRKSATHIFDAVFSETGLLVDLRCAVVLVTHATQFLTRFEHILLISSGTIAHSGTYHEVLASGALDDYILSSTSSAGSKKTSNAADDVEVTSDGQIILKKPHLDLEETSTSRAPSEWSVYGYFLQSCGSLTISIFFVLAAVMAGGRSFEAVWLKMWAEGDHTALGYYMGVLTALIVGGVTLLGGLCISSISYVVSVGSSTLANRFIQDIMLVDDELPMAFVNTTTAFFGVIAETIIVMMSHKFVAASVPVLVLTLWVIQKFYLRTSKQLRLMDIEAKAPLSAFLLETLEGMVSIRAFDRTSEFSSRNTVLLNYSQRAAYMLLSVQVWLKMILDFVVALLAVLVVALAVNFRNSQSLGYLGLALVNLISLSTSFKYLITFWANLEMSIGAVARIKRFNNDVEPEDDHELPPPYINWPVQGEIEFRNVSASYRYLPPAVYDISLRIAPGTKVAICGRSGSGKSSLIATLLRCLDLNSGSVIIDAQDISRISRDAYRKRIMTLPQKSLFIHDSIRANMLLWDEDTSRSQEEIDAAIEEALRKKTKEEKEKEKEPVTLDSPLNPSERLSVGQQQLFCLARGLFQRGDARIVLMDEFTSSMDHETEMLVREIIGRDLRGRTVVEVLHRLEHILDFDLVVVLDQGRIAEAGNPEELLENEEGMLRGLYQSMRG